MEFLTDYREATICVNAKKVQRQFKNSFEKLGGIVTLQLLQGTHRKFWHSVKLLVYVRKSMLLYNYKCSFVRIQDSLNCKASLFLIKKYSKYVYNFQYKEKLNLQVSILKPREQRNMLYITLSISHNLSNCVCVLCVCFSCKKKERIYSLVRIKSLSDLEEPCGGPFQLLITNILISFNIIKFYLFVSAPVMLILKLKILKRKSMFLMGTVPLR